MSVKLAMYSCRRNSVATFLLLSHLVATAASQSGPVNASDFPGQHSGSRLAYFRWRAWLLSRPAVVQKVPPVPKMAEANASDSLDVRVKMIPLHVLNVDEAHQTVQAAARLQFRWVHPALAVDSNLAQVFTDGNSSLLPYSVTVPSKVLWLPALVAVEGVSVLEIMQDINEVEVQRDGGITVTLPSILTFMCRFDMTGYPFDQHDCSVTVMDTSLSVNVHPPGTPWDRSIAERFGVAGEWDLVNFTEKSLICPFTGQICAQFILHLQRKTTFYSVILITPLVLTSYLNALVFLLPPDLGDQGLLPRHADHLHVCLLLLLQRQHAQRTRFHAAHLPTSHFYFGGKFLYLGNECDRAEEIQDGAVPAGNGKNGSFRCPGRARKQCVSRAMCRK